MKMRENRYTNRNDMTRNTATQGPYPCWCRFEMIGVQRWEWTRRGFCCCRGRNGAYFVTHSDYILSGVSVYVRDAPNTAQPPPV
jgi:hypothetical protein